MTKKKETEFISTEVEKVVQNLEKREELNTQLIDEVDKQLTIAKYGSVGHANKVVRISSLRNYRLRLKEVIQTLKQITDYKSVETIETYVEQVLEDSKTNLKVSNDALNSTVEIFTSGYMKHEILIKTYKDLIDLYTETLKTLSDIREKTRPTDEEQADEPVEEEKPKKESK